ncbi:hypothetical protein BJX61DRAFT_540856 [Aspergillus egyptiacus]|nr:hypothetical protein BJX61DRAFT_540856 [Aspergillus egyptiacus]
MFSPNHLELAGLSSEPLSPTTANILDKRRIVSLAVTLISNGVGPGGNDIAILRAGEHGRYLSARRLGTRWLPPFDPSGDSKVVDPTGAGNSFLGAFAIRYLSTGDIVQAACYGSVAALFAAEQVGMPRRSVSGEGTGEIWNGESVLGRLREYQGYVGL